MKEVLSINLRIAIFSKSDHCLNLSICNTMIIHLEYTAETWEAKTNIIAFIARQKTKSECIINMLRAISRSIMDFINSKCRLRISFDSIDKKDVLGHWVGNSSINSVYKNGIINELYCYGPWTYIGTCCTLKDNGNILFIE